MRPSSAAVFSASSPVPSGLLSSTTRMSASGTALRARSRKVAMFSASWYVGVTTSVRTGELYRTRSDARVVTFRIDEVLQARVHVVVAVETELIAHDPVRLGGAELS